MLKGPGDSAPDEKSYSGRYSRPYAPFHERVDSRNARYPYFLMNSSDSRYFLYLYPFLAKKPWIMGQSSYSGQSAQVSSFFSMRQQRFMEQRAARRSRFPSSYPSLHPLQVMSGSARHVPQYAPQQPMDEVSGGGMCMNIRFLPLVQSIDRMSVGSGKQAMCFYREPAGTDPCLRYFKRYSCRDTIT